MRQIITMIFVLFLIGCGRSTSPAPSLTNAIPSDYLLTQTHPTSTASEEIRVEKPLSQTPSVIPSATFSRTVISRTTSTLLPVGPTVTKWNTFTHPMGISIEYPATWTVTVINYDSYSFITFHNSILEIYLRRPEDKQTADPHTWQPNEGGYKILWENPVVVDGAKGYEFVWGADSAAYVLHGILYNEKYGLDVRLSEGLDMETHEDFDPRKFDRIIEAKHEIFRYMLRSIKFHPPSEIPTNTPYPTRTLTPTET